MNNRGRGSTGPKLPRSLLDQFNADGATKLKRKNEGRRTTQFISRKDKRKADREHKRVLTHRPPPRKQKIERTDSEDESDSAQETVRQNSNGGQDFAAEAHQSPVRQPNQRLHLDSSTARNNRKSPPLKHEGPLQSAPLVSKHTKERLEADDAEIAALEKKLGLKGNKLPKSFHDDGLGDLLEGVEGGTLVQSRKRKGAPSDDAWLDEKRKRHTVEAQEGDLGDMELLSIASSDDGLAFEEGGVEMENNGDVMESSEGVYEEDEFDGFTSDEGMEKPTPKKITAPPLKRVKENPYIAPPTDDHQSQQPKYVPPSRRSAEPGDEELQKRLRRQLQGLMNRMSDSNILSIVDAVEKLFQSNPRQYVSSALVDLLLGAVCNPMALNDSMIILHSGFVAALYKTVGQDLGAQMLEGTVQKFDHFHADSSTAVDAAGTSAGKEPVNLLSLLGYLFNFQVIGSELIFDYIREFLGTLTEQHTELLLRIVKTSGQQLRQDDPSSLKDIVALLQRTMAASGSETAHISVRTQFMVETINDLKNNRLKAGGGGSGVAAEHASKMRKTLGSLNSRGAVRASEPLRASLADLRDADNKGKWWLVGASWKGGESKSAAQQGSAAAAAVVDGDERRGSDSGDSEAGDARAFSAEHVSRLAQQHGMHTPLRRSIFAALVTAADYRDAHARLLKLDLSRAQQREITRVLLHCVAAESSYNNYYGLVARQLCSGHRKMSVAFQFGLWDFLKRIGADEQGAAGERDFEDHREHVEKHEIANHAKFFGWLIGMGALSITALKIMDPLGLLMRSSHTEQMSAQPSLFLEILLIAVFNAVSMRSKRSASLQRQSSSHLEIDAEGNTPKPSNQIIEIFAAALEVPKFATGLRAFLSRVVQKSDFVPQGHSKRSRNLREDCKAACRALEDKSRSNADVSADNKRTQTSDQEEDW